MRSTNSIKNAVVALIMNTVNILIGFVAQRIFVQALGAEYLGINGLFNNVLSMLGIVELGLGSAIIYHIYKPIAEEDIEKIKSLMLFYKIGYRVIASLIAIIGLCVIPFLHYIVGEVSISENIIYIYILFLVDIIASYLLTYKRSILYANQKNYIVNLVHIGYYVVMNFVQIAILLNSKNYILYLWTKVVCRILENMVITVIANKMYPYIKEKNSKPLDKQVQKSIFTKVKGLLYHKIGGVIVFGTDNIIISKFFGVITVGLYSNYQLILQALNTLFTQVFTSLTASVGNLLVEKNEEKSYTIYKNMLFINSWIFTFGSCGLLCIMEPFIKIWVGSEFILPSSVLLVLVINFYIQGMRRTSNTFKEAAGIVYVDRYVPLIEALVNIMASIILAKIFGLMGVCLGTIISTFIVFLYGYPIFVYKPIFKKSYFQYLKDYIPYVLTTIIAVTITYIITSKIIIGDLLLQIVINLIIVVIIPNLIYYILLRNTEEFKYYKNMVTNIMNSIKIKLNKKSV